MPAHSLRQDAPRLRPVPRARKPVRWQPLPQPLALEGSYSEALVSLLDKAWARILSALAPVLAEAEKDEREDALHADAKPKKRRASVTFEVVVENLPERVEEPFSLGSVAPAAEKVAKATDAAHLRNLRQQFAKAVGVQVLQAEPALAPVVRDFTKRNVGLIKSLKGEVLERLQRELGKALDSGARPPELAKLLREQYGMAKRHAELIARDQVGKLYASLTEERHKKLGITRYKWRTVRDNRVRKLHEKREGVVFEYAKPPREDPTDGHPGRGVRCRCYAEPVIDDVLSPEATVKREAETVDPAPPEAPRPPRAVAPVEKVTQALERVKRAARAVAPPEAPPAKAARVRKAVAQAQSVAVDRTKGWKAERVYRVPLEELEDVPAVIWQPGRAESIHKAVAEGFWDKMEPVRVYSEDKRTGTRELADGNHRLAVARELRRMGRKDITHINVRFSDREAAALMARSRTSDLPWFVRDNPERFPELVNPDGTPKKPSR